MGTFYQFPTGQEFLFQGIPGQPFLRLEETTMENPTISNLQTRISELEEEIIDERELSDNLSMELEKSEKREAETRADLIAAREWVKRYHLHSKESENREKEIREIYIGLLQSIRARWSRVYMELEEESEGYQDAILLLWTALGSLFENSIIDVTTFDNLFSSDEKERFIALLESLEDRDWPESS